MITKIMRVQKKNLSDQIISRIRDYIEEQNLKVGDRLPTEQEMADQFGVSRISIREATKALSFFGIIESAPRRGLTLGPVDIMRVQEILGFHLKIGDYPKKLLLKARQVIEIGALLYAMEAVSSDTALYKKLISMCDKLDTVKDHAKFIAIDTEFHRTILEASGIEPLLAFNDVLQAFFLKFRDNIMEETEAGLTGGSLMHRKIVNALRHGRLSTAENALRKHLETYAKTISQ